VGRGRDAGLAFADVEMEKGQAWRTGSLAPRPPQGSVSECCVRAGAPAADRVGSLCNRRSTANGLHDHLTNSMPLGSLNYDIETLKRKSRANVICGFRKGYVMCGWNGPRHGRPDTFTAPPAPP
jgi:hypothetical protein